MNHNLCFLLHYTKSSIPIVTQLLRTFPEYVDLIIHKVGGGLNSTEGATGCKIFKEIMRIRLYDLCDFVEKTSYEYVVFIDSDIVFNTKFKEEDITHEYDFSSYLVHLMEDYDMRATSDPNSAMVYNTGIWIIKVNSLTKQFLTELKDEISLVEDLDECPGIAWPQGVLNEKLEASQLSHSTLPPIFFSHHARPDNYLMWHLLHSAKEERMKKVISELQ